MHADGCRERREQDQVKKQQGVHGQSFRLLALTPGLPQ
jgi:hypothetical protein